MEDRELQKKKRRPNSNKEQDASETSVPTRNKRPREGSQETRVRRRTPSNREEYLEELRAKRLNGQQIDEEKKPTERQEQPRVRPTRTGKKIRDVSKKRKKQKRNKILLASGFVVVFLALVASVVGMLYMKKYGLSDEEMSGSKYYDISRDSDLVVVLDTEIMGVGGMVVDEVPYISYEVVLEYLNDRFYWDEGENVLLYTLEDGTVKAELGDSEYSQGNEVTQTDYQIIKTEGSQVYVAAEYVQVYTNIDFTFYADPYRISITSDWGEIQTVTVKKNTQVRYQAGVKSSIISYVSEGDKLIYLEEEADIGEWTKVCTADGYVGYLQTKTIEEIETETISREFEEQVYSNISVDYTINMAWHQVSTSEANDTLLSSVADADGITTVAPTWFFIDSTDGEVTSLASQTYVNYAHQLGIDVWAVLNDFDGGINSYDETYEVLSSSSAREKIINTVIAEAIQYGIDGINVDIEKVSSDCGVHFVQFIRELSVKCRQNDIVLSVDNYPPKSYNLHYDYEEQGEIVDYIIIMGYDEHYGGSPEAGSVSSITYIEESITEMLTMVSSDKVVCAIPFYTRLWESTPKTDEELAEQEGTDDAEYIYNVSSQAYGMTSAANVVAQAGVTAEWDETTMQYYATWTVDDTICEIWLEEEESIDAKLQVIYENDLAGVSAWKLGFETSEIWNVIAKYVN